MSIIYECQLYSEKGRSDSDIVYCPMKMSLVFVRWIFKLELLPHLVHTCRDKYRRDDFQTNRNSK